MRVTFLKSSRTIIFMSLSLEGMQLQYHNENRSDSAPRLSLSEYASEANASFVAVRPRLAQCHALQLKTSPRYFFRSAWRWLHPDSVLQVGVRSFLRRHRVLTSACIFPLDLVCFSELVLTSSEPLAPSLRMLDSCLGFAALSGIVFRRRTPPLAFLVSSV